MSRNRRRGRRRNGQSSEGSARNIGAQDVNARDVGARNVGAGESSSRERGVVRRSPPVSMPEWVQRPGFESGPGVWKDREPAAGSELTGIWEVLRLRRRLVFGVTAMVFTAVAIGTFVQRPVYRAAGLVEFRKHGADVVPLEALFEVARIPDQHLETQYSVLRSPALARRVITNLGLEDSEEFSRLPDSTSAQPVPATEGLVRRFGRELDVDPVTDSRIVQVSFEAGDPVLAARVVNAVFAHYTALRVEAARSAVDRLAEQVDSARVKLVASEGRLHEYVRANELVLVENSTGETENMVQERLRQLQQQVTEAEANRYEAESRFDLVRRGNYDALASDVLRELSVRVAELQGEYAKLRTTFTDEYPRTRELKRQLDALTSQLNRERSRLAAELRGQHQSAVRHQDLLREAFDEQKALADRLAARTAEYRILKRDVEGHQQLFTVLQQKQKEAGVSMALAPAEISVVDAAVPPESPVRPLPARNLPLGLIVGLLLGVAAAYLREYTDPAIHTVDEVEDFASTVPILALIPAAARSTTGRTILSRTAQLPVPQRIRALLPAPQGDPGPAEPWVRIDREDPYDSPLTEAFGSLRTSVLLEHEGPLPRSLLVTSGQAGEGKTTIAVNLAISIARLGRRTLLIDADLRRPSVHSAFGLHPQPGLAECLAGECGWRDAVRRRAFGGLDILPAGVPPDRPSELLSSERLHALLDGAESEYDVVVVDSAALLVNVPDARILAPLIGGVVLVVRNAVTPRVLLRRLLPQAPNVIGIVVNDIDPDRLPGYYGSYLASDPGAQGRSPAWRSTLRELASVVDETDAAVRH